MQDGSSKKSDEEISLGALLEEASNLERQDRFDDAERLYLAILAQYPDQFDALHRVGVIRSRQGKLDDAARLIRRALSGNPVSAVALNDLGNVLLALRRPGEAIKHYEKAIAANPEFASAHCNLAVAMTDVGHMEEALGHYEQAILIDPDYADAHNNLGALLQRLGRGAEGVGHFEAAVATNPKHVDALSNLGAAFLMLGVPEKTIEYCRRALEIKRDIPEAYSNIGNALIKLGRPREAIQEFQAAISLRPSFAEAYNFLGMALDAVGDAEQAIIQLQNAIALDASCADSHAKMGAILLRDGNLTEAHAEYEHAARLSPKNPNFFIELAQLKRFEKDDPHLEIMAELVASSVSDEQRIGLHFALGKAYSDVAEYEAAARHMVAGNSLHRQRTQYDEVEALRELQRTVDLFTPELIQKLSGFGNPSDVPIFILGMPRSGTTLIEQILASHPAVYGAGELLHLSECVDRLPLQMGNAFRYPEFAPGMTEEWLRLLGEDYLQALARKFSAARVTDKMPHNFRFVGLIHLAFPNARIIHARRDPIDTCLSCYSVWFGERQAFTYDLAELGRLYRSYQRLMRHWRQLLPPQAMIEVDYEVLVSNFEVEARRILTYCGLDWHPACLDFHKTRRPIQTASVVQVRQPLYSSSVGRWRPYEKMLQPLLRELCEDGAPRLG